MFRGSMVLSAAVGMLLPLAAKAQTLYSDNFDTNTTANYNVNLGTAGTQSAAFAFDYSTVGIPAAPGSGGTTLGLKLSANASAANQAFSGLSVSPIGLSLSGDYKITAQLWTNFVASGSGSTEATGIGILSNGTADENPGTGVAGAVYFSTTYDGGSSVDYRMYTPAAPTGLDGTTSAGTFAAGAGTDSTIRNQSNAYYTSKFPSTKIPAAQITAYPTQGTASSAEYSQTTGSLAGSPAFNWYTFEVDKVGNIASYYIGGYLIGTVDLTQAGTTTGTDLLINAYDTNANATTDANGAALNFALYDNLVVTQVPEPASMSMLALSAVGVLGRRRRA